MKHPICLSTIFLFLALMSCEQKSFQHPITDLSYVVAPDISNQQIGSFAEDSFGHVWIGTFRGLNRYNTREFHQYFNTNDTLSIPDNQVKSILCDSQNRIWVATANGVCRYNDQDCWERVSNKCNEQYVFQILENHTGRIFIRTSKEIGVYLPEEDNFRVGIPELDYKHRYILKCFIDQKNNLWVVRPQLIRCYDSNTLKLIKSIEMEEHLIHNAFLTDSGEIWFTSDNTALIFDIKTDDFIETPEVIRKHPQLLDAAVEYVHNYTPTALLINTKEGFFLYNCAEEKVIGQNEVGFPFNPPKCKVTTMFTDSQNNLWIGSTDQGFVICYNYKERFNNNNYLRTHTENQSIIAVMADVDNLLWITTDLDGVLVYDMNRETIRPVETTHLFSEQKHSAYQIKSIFQDSNQKIWLLGNSKLVRCSYNKRLNTLQQEEAYRIERFKSEIAEDKNGTIWAATWSNKLYALRKGSRTFEEVELFPPTATFTFTNDLIVLTTGEVVVGAFPYNPQLINPDTWELTEWDVTSAIERSEFIPVCLHQDSQGDVWIGTISNGLLRYSTKRKSIERMEGTSCTEISSIQEDAEGNIWVGTLYGLSKYNRNTNQFTNYYKVDGIGGNQFNERAVCRLKNGTIVFGGTHGITHFNPNDIIVKRDIPLLFTHLKIDNQPIHPFQSDCIDKALMHNPTIVLNHKQNSFAISFVALDYSEYERVHYHYRMECFDNYWIDANHNREAYYSNLPPGKYTFRVRITNNDNSIAETEKAISIVVKPAPWATWWAYSLYWMLILTAGYMVIRQYHRNRMHTLRIAQAELEKMQEQRLNKMNMSFFANIAHEFRTPLTMISGPIVQLCHTQEIQGEHKQLLHIVQRSVNRMLKLVNQLMDFNKLENDTLKLGVERADVVAEINQLIDVFRINGINKKIDLKTHGLESSFISWIDKDKLNKINSNLISNALKFTKQNGKITIQLDVITPIEAAQIFDLTEKERQSEYIKVTITDTGCGIPEDKLERIFERYYQISEQNKGTYNWGTGIGLYYIRCLIKLHHGYIKAANNSPTGAVFTYILPISDTAYPECERLVNGAAQEFIYPLQSQEELPNPPNGNPTEQQQSVLVVDDDGEVAYYLKTLLSSHYKVVCCFDAEQGYKVLQEESIDIVLSDVVMPGTDGYRFCKRIKENIELSHIPVVLITAKTTIENQVEGLETGADAYVTKPFDPTYLLALINSQLKNREKVRNLLINSTKADKIEVDMLSPHDNSFMSELYQLMESELSNPELNITRLTAVLKISRTKFYYKVKGLTGVNPNVFFSTYKLNRAAELLTEGKFNISEIADMTGYSTLPHFSSSFKKQFGVTPSKYRK